MAGKNVAVLGCGGSGRTIAAAIQRHGGQVVMFNRGAMRAELAARLLGVSSCPISEFRGNGFDIIVNATPIGRDWQACPIPPWEIPSGAVVLDLVYSREPTVLVQEAITLGATAISGHEVLVCQVERQFLLMTGRQMPSQIVAQVMQDCVSGCVYAATGLNAHATSGRDLQATMDLCVRPDWHQS